MKRVFSGVQPTGNLHLGNYLGAIKNWVEIQYRYDSIFCIVDLHAITVPQDPTALRANIREVAATYMACGIDPNKSIIFNQSRISGHSELAWLLGCNTPIGWLNRMTQFKEKAGKDKENASLGLYSYPVLMAADILLYQTEIVPVGDDQKQHLELARDIAGAFNRHYEQNFFNIPEPLMMGEATRVMSLRDGKAKMSKSDLSDYSRINLTDDADLISKKIKKATSDMVEGVFYDPENRPEASNLLDIYAEFGGDKEDFREKGFAEFKKSLAELLVEKITPIGKKIAELNQDITAIDHILHDGAEKAGAIAEKNLQDVKNIIGFLI